MGIRSASDRIAFEPLAAVRERTVGRFLLSIRRRGARAPSAALSESIVLSGANRL